MPWHRDDSLTGWPGPFQPAVQCPACGSREISLGCPYQDCDSCPDVEASSCNKCGAGWGGADYWVQPSRMIPESKWEWRSGRDTSENKATTKCQRCGVQLIGGMLTQHHEKMERNELAGLRIFAGGVTTLFITQSGGVSLEGLSTIHKRAREG